MRKWEKCILHRVERKGTSCYGNPSYWILFSDSEGHFYAGYTASNASAGYTASSYKTCDAGQVIYLDYHFTKKGNCIIDYIKHDLPTEATREAEGEKGEIMKMSKIQFDTIYGVRNVEEFDSEIEMVSQKDVFDYLHTAEDGTIYGCEVDEETFAKIEEEYGIK